MSCTTPNILLLCILLLNIFFSDALVDFYVSKDEMKRLFGNVSGQEAQMNFVANGKVNIHALTYPLTTYVWWNISQIHFHWKSYATNDVYYNISIIPEKSGVLTEPFLIKYPSHGVIPKVETGFGVSLKCVNSRSGEATVFIDINYTWPSKTNKTYLRLIRRKFCSVNASITPTTTESKQTNVTSLLTKDADRLVVKKNGPNPSRSESAAYYYGAFGAAGNIFYVAIGCIFGFIIVIASLVVLYFARKKPDGYELTPSGGVEQQISSNSNAVVARVFPIDNQENNYRARYSSQSSTSKYSAYSNGGTGTSLSLINKNNIAGETNSVVGAVLKFDAKDVDVNYLLEHLIVSRDKVQPMKLELEGTFGEIFSGYLIEDDGEAEDILIKTVKIGSASEIQISKFLSESLTLSGLPTHPNIGCVLAACDSGPEDLTPMLCYSHRGFGNLKKFLIKCRGAEASHSLVTQDLVHMALQIIRGVTHLHQNKILHRDIATRNCLITEDLTVQICDTGLSRDLFPQDYHCLGDNENRPVKWLAGEALERHDFSSASDVWAFGVTLWELITLAQQPYADVDPFEMNSVLLEGQRLMQPYNCPDELFMLMYCCWNNHAEARPTFFNLLKALEHFYAQLNQYI